MIPARTQSQEDGMRSKGLMIVICALFATLGAPARAQRAGGAAPQPQAAPADDPVKTLVSRLDLETYKSTIKGLTQFGDRRQGTDRNRAAIDWIEAQLKGYGCTNTERLKYNYHPTATGPSGPSAGPSGPSCTEGTLRFTGIRIPI